MEKVAVVTGGTRGIGLAISKNLMREGYKVAAIYHGNEEAAKKAVRDYGCTVYKADVCDFDKCKSVIDRIETELGPVTTLVNNAGITRDGVMHKMPLESWEAVLNTNLTSCFNMCRAVIVGMRERKYGRIVNISSINGQKGQFGQTNYSAAKAGMIGLTKALALESANKKITVNAVCPGYIGTEMTEAINADILQSIIQQIPVGRLGTPDEVAALVNFLCSEKSAFITGAVISANGGQYLSG